MKRISKELKIFSLVLFLTIVVLRLLARFYNVEPTIYGFELHHLDYGIALMALTAALVLSGAVRGTAAYVLSAISLALIIDEIFFIRALVVEPVAYESEVLLYNSTLPYVAATVLSVFLLAFVFGRVITTKHKKRK